MKGLNVIHKNSSPKPEFVSNESKFTHMVVMVLRHQLYSRYTVSCGRERDVDCVRPRGVYGMLVCKIRGEKWGVRPKRGEKGGVSSSGE